MSANAYDQQKADDFLKRLVTVYNGGALALMCSVGHRTGLFDTMADMPPATSSQIAEAAGLNERYVREWLGAMVTGRIVEYDLDKETYHLPAEHAAILTRAVGSDNLALYMQYIGMLGSVEDQIVDCFHNGGGVPYPAFARFHEVMAEDSNETVVAALVDSILSIVPGLIEALHSGIQVLDIGCGMGRAVNRMAQVFPNSHFSGYDFSEEAVAVGQAEAETKGLSNTHFAAKDVVAFDEPAQYDLITTFDVIHDQAQPARVLRNIARALKSDGVYLMQDIAASSYVHKNLKHPIGPFLYTISTMHCMTVSLAQGGEGLGAMWGKEKALEMLAEAGFTNTEVHELPHDPTNYYYVSTK